MEFIETPVFSKLVGKYLDEDEYSALQWFLILHPEAGVVIPGSGGFRKLRWRAKGSGKRGGLRVIYYLNKRLEELWLLTIYSKKEAQDSSIGTLRALRKEIES